MGSRRQFPHICWTNSARPKHFDGDKSSFTTSASLCCTKRWHNFATSSGPKGSRFNELCSRHWQACARRTASNGSICMYTEKKRKIKFPLRMVVVRSVHTLVVSRCAIYSKMSVRLSGCYTYRNGPTTINKHRIFEQQPNCQYIVC